MQTEPPPSATFSETVNQWVIYDAYVDYEYKKEMQDEQDLKGRRATDKQAKKRLLGDGNKDDGHEISQKVVRAAKVLERMVNQNIYIDIALGILWYNIQLIPILHGHVNQQPCFLSLIFTFQRFPLLGRCVWRVSG